MRGCAAPARRDTTLAAGGRFSCGRPSVREFFESCCVRRPQTLRRACLLSPPGGPRQGFSTGDGASCPPAGKLLLLKGLILAQNERWRRGLGMQVERIPFG